MKKILSLMLVLCMMLVLFSVPVAATEVASITIPDTAELIYTNDCTSLDGWAVNGVKITENAYNIEGSAVTASGANKDATLGFPEEVQKSKNVIVTAKFYSSVIDHAFRIKVVGSGWFFGGNFKANQYGAAGFNAHDGSKWFNTKCPQSVGWHEYALMVDGDGVITHYIDGKRVTNNGAEFSENIGTNKISGIHIGVPGWIKGYEGAITDIRVYELETSEYTITFDVGEYGTTTGETVVTVLKGEIPTAPVVTGKEGYIFAGWDKEIVAAESDTVYTAKYTSNFISAAVAECENAEDVNTIVSANLEILGLEDYKPLYTKAFSNVEREGVCKKILLGTPADDAQVAELFKAGVAEVIIPDAEDGEIVMYDSFEQNVTDLNGQSPEIGDGTWTRTAVVTTDAVLSGNMALSGKQSYFSEGGNNKSVTGYLTEADSYVITLYVYDSLTPNAQSNITFDLKGISNAFVGFDIAAQHNANWRGRKGVNTNITINDKNGKAIPRVKGWNKVVYNVDAVEGTRLFINGAETDYAMPDVKTVQGLDIIQRSGWNINGIKNAVYVDGVSIIKYSDVVIDNVTIKQDDNVKGTFRINVGDCSDDNVDEKNYTVNWYIKEEGEYKLLKTVNGFDFEPGQDNGGKTFMAEITAMNPVGIKSNTVTVEITENVLLNIVKPELSEVKLAGEGKAYEKLSISYNYNGETEEEGSVYTWYVNGRVSDRFTTKEITLTPDLFGKEIYACVIPCDSRGAYGKEYFTEKLIVTGDALTMFNGIKTALDGEILIKAYKEELGIAEDFDSLDDVQKFNLYNYFKNHVKGFDSMEEIKAAFDEFIGDNNNGEIDEITMLRHRYYTYLAGSDEKLKYADAMKEKAASRDASVKQYLEKLVPEGDNPLERERVFTDIIPERSYQGGRAMQSHFERLTKMAQAYKDCYSAYYNDRELLESIISVLSWLTYAKAPDGYAWYGAETWDYYYDRNNPRAASPMSKANWWQLEVGIPLADTQLIALVFDELETYAPQLKEDALMTLDTFIPDPEVSSGGISGANGAWANKMVILTSILRGNPPITEEQLANPRYFNAEKTDKLRACKNRLESQIFYTTGNGYHTDGSYVDHNYYAYTGGYGHNMWISLIELEYLLTGTSYELSEEKSSILRNWTFDSMEPFIYKSKMYLDMVRGREVGMGNAGIGNPDIGVRLLMQAEAAEGETRDRLISLAKYIAESICEGRGTNVISSGSACFDPKLMDLMADASVLSRGEVDRSQIFPDMCRIVHYRENYGIGLPFYDKSIYTHEDGGDFSVGWNTGSGMIWLYNDDITQYTGDYWPTVNAYRMAGTTVSKNTKKGGANSSNHAGGATVDVYTVAAFEQAHPGTTMRAQKSYFLFDDEIVMLGSDISSSDAPAVETIVENRKIEKDNSNVLTVNGNTVVPDVGDAQVIDDVSWAHLSGKTQKADIGYYFPEGAKVNAERYEGSGKWSSISTNNQINNTKIVTNKYVSMWFDHGVNPENETYSYALLPGKTAAEVEAYANNPAYEVLANNEKVQGVYHSGLDILAANFWTDEETDFAGKITSDKKASVIMQKKDGIITVGISDPARENTGKIRMKFTELSSIISKDDRVEIISCGADGIVVDVNVNGAKGQTITFVASDSEGEISGLPLTYDFEDGEIHAKVKTNSDNASVTNVTIPGTETKGVKFDVKTGNAVKTYSFEGENGLDGFVASIDRSSLTLSTDYAHSGTQSIKFSPGTTYNQSLSLENGDYIVEVWMYDTGAKATAMISAGINAGVYGAMNANYYLLREGSSWSATSVKRSVGWHKFTFDASSGTELKVYIDDTLVKTSTTTTKISAVTFLDWWANGNQGALYIDDLTVTNANPAPVEMTVDYEMPFLTAIGEYTVEADFYSDYNGETAIYPFVVYQNSETKLVSVGLRNENIVIKTTEGDKVLTAKAEGKNTIKAELNTEAGTFNLYVNGTKMLTEEPFFADGEFISGICSNIKGEETTVFVDNVKVYKTEDESFVKGDIDGNGKVAMNDVTKGLKIVAGTEVASDREIKAADLDGNGKVAITEIVKIIKYIARLIPSL